MFTRFYSEPSTPKFFHLSSPSSIVHFFLFINQIHIFIKNFIQTQKKVLKKNGYVLFFSYDNNTTRKTRIVFLLPTPFHSSFFLPFSFLFVSQQLNTEPNLRTLFNTKTQEKKKPNIWITITIGILPDPESSSSSSSFLFIHPSLSRPIVPQHHHQQQQGGRRDK